MQQPQQRASRLRLVALASTVALAVALPLAAATAGEDVPAPQLPTGGGTPDAKAPDAAGARHERPAERQAERPAGDERPHSSCGPEITSPEGVEAQTCVLTEGDAVWARTYYRNATNGQLRTAVTLLRPDGRTTQASCGIPAADEPGLCETPRVPVTEGVKGVESAEREEGEKATAVAEVASLDGERLLLRSGSGNSPAMSRT